jgi:hypothetical protein
MEKLTGRLEILDMEYVRKKANANDPRAIFPQAMLICQTWEAYMAKVGMKMVEVSGFRKGGGAVDGRQEALYFIKMKKVA